MPIPGLDLAKIAPCFELLRYPKARTRDLVDSLAARVGSEGAQGISAPSVFVFIVAVGSSFAFYELLLKRLFGAGKPAGG